MKPLKLMSAALAVMLSSVIAMLPAQSADIYNPTVSIDEGVIANNGVDWTGFYAGLLTGYGWGDQDHDLSGVNPVIGADVSNFLSHEPDGFLFGGTVGINYQPRDSRVVVGLEGDWSFANHQDGKSVTEADGTPFLSEILGDDETLFSETEVNSIGTARVRAGYLVNPQLMPYVTGGLAWASVNSSVRYDDQDDPEDNVSLTEEDTNVGWTIGAGLEYKLDNVWSVKAEYLYVDLADTEHTVSFDEGAVSLTDDLTEHMVRVGVNAKLF